MNEQYASTKEALAAYITGAATLDEVSGAADRAIEAYFDRAGLAPTDTISAEDTRTSRDVDAPAIVVPGYARSPRFVDRLPRRGG